MNTLISIVLALVPFIVGIAVYYVQKSSHKDMFFKKCAESLYSTNATEQITAAIMLREYANDASYESRVKNMMVALLRTSIPSSLQKVIADLLDIPVIVCNESVVEIIPDWISITLDSIKGIVYNGNKS